MSCDDFAQVYSENFIGSECESANNNQAQIGSGSESDAEKGKPRWNNSQPDSKYFSTPESDSDFLRNKNKKKNKEKNKTQIGSKSESDAKKSKPSLSPSHPMASLFDSDFSRPTKP